MTGNYGERNIGIGVYNAIEWIYALATNTTQIAVDVGGISLHGIVEPPDHTFHYFDV